MKVVEGRGAVPVIFSAHHASHEFGEFSERCALTTEQRIRFSDYGTAETVPLNGLFTVIAERSRALGDLNRAPDDDGGFQEKDYAKPDKHPVWKDGQGLTDKDKAYCRENFYHPYHKKIVELLAGREELTFVVAWDNTAHYEIGENEAGEPVIMKPFIISNRGQQGSAEPDEKEPVSCDPEFMDIFKEKFKDELEARDLPSEIHLNLVYKGGHIARTYSTNRNGAELRKKGIRAPVQALQIEYDTAITHDQETLEPYVERIEALREAASAAFENAYAEYIKANST